MVVEVLVRRQRFEIEEEAAGKVCELSRNAGVMQQLASRVSPGV